MLFLPKFLPVPAPRRSVTLLGTVFGALILTASVAQAFTFSDQPSGGSDSGTKFTDPADRAKSRMNGNTGDRTTIQGGNTTFQFGGRESFDERYDSNRMFSPNNLTGR